MIELASLLPPRFAMLFVQWGESVAGVNSDKICETFPFHPADDVSSNSLHAELLFADSMS